MVELDVLRQVLAAMIEKAGEVYETSAENYAVTRGPRRGLAVVTVQDDTDPDVWLSLESRFGGLCWGQPKSQNGRDIDLGVSNDGLAHGKIAYCRRTGNNSGADVRDVRGAESYWQGALFSEDHKALFAFSGFSETDDVLVAAHGKALYEKLAVLTPAPL